MYLADPATGNLEAGSLGFPAFKKMLKLCPISKLLLRASYEALPM
jgi:hypothetical protein